MKKVNVLVTGGAGFIGSHLVDKLISLNYKVTILDNLVSGKKEYINQKANYFKIDIVTNDIKSIIKKEKPDYIFHLAAQSSITKSLQDPKVDIETNLIGTQKIIEAASFGKVQKIIFASSAAVYGFANTLPTTEIQMTLPFTTYGLTKLCSEYLLKLQDIPYVVLRFSNVYGPRQNIDGEGGVIAIFAGKIKKKKPLMIYGDGKQTRDFIYVGDIIGACVSSLTEKVQGTFNICTSKETTIIKLAKYLDISNNKIIYKDFSSIEVKRSSMSYTKFKKITGWKPKVDIKTGIRNTLNYIQR